MRNPIYKNALHCAKTIRATEGVSAFYKGTLAPLSGIAICTSVQFGLNELFKSMFQGYNVKVGKERPSDLTVAQYFLCGALAGVGNSFFSTPVEHIRIRLQSQAGVLDPKERFTGSYDALSKIYRNYGMKAIYRGYGATLARDVVAFATFFGMYEGLKQRFADYDKVPRLLKLMAFGGFSSVFLWTASYPADVVKTVIQSDSLNKPNFMNSLEA